MADLPPELAAFAAQIAEAVQRQVLAAMGSGAAPAMPPIQIVMNAPAAAPAAKVEPTFRELWPKYWMAEGKFKADARTRKGRAATLLKYFGDCQPDEITSVRVAAYRTERGRQKTKYDEPPAIATVNREVALLRRVLSWASHPDQEMIARSRLRGMKMPKEKNIKKAKLLEPELMRLASKIQLEKPAGLCLWGVVLALADCGMREREAFDLQWTQFDHKSGRVTLLTDDVKGEYMARTPRLSPRSLALILDLPRVSPYVFANPKTRTRYSIRYLYRLYQEALTRADLHGPGGESITFHTLRHTFQYRARVEWKLSQPVIKTIMGHKTNSASERYGIVDQQEVTAAFDERDRCMAEAVDKAAERHPPQRAPSRALEESA